MPETTLLATDLPFPVFRRGKVRDVYDLGGKLLIVATGETRRPHLSHLLWEMRKRLR